MTYILYMTHYTYYIYDITYTTNIIYESKIHLYMNIITYNLTFLKEMALQNDKT